MPIPMREVLHRGREFFMGQSDVHEAAERICRTLDEMNECPSRLLPASEHHGLSPLFHPTHHRPL